jgi:hypothetical protein
VNGTNVQVISPTEITVVTPAVPAVRFDGATVDVKVTTPVGTSTTSSADHYMYALTTVAEADASADGTVVTLDNDPIVTAILQRPNDPTTAYTNWEFLIDDSSATYSNGQPTNSDSIMVNATPASLGSYTPTVGDALKITGTVKFANGSIQLPELQSITSVTKISSGNAEPADFDPTITAEQVLHITSGASPYAGQLVTVSNVNLPNAGNVYFGTGNASYGPIVDSSDPETTPTVYNQPELYYYANSFGEAVDHLDGLQVPGTGSGNYTGTFTGIVSYDYGDPVNLLVTAIPGITEKFTYTLADTSGNPLPSDQQITTAKDDGFSQINRGSSIVVTVDRSEAGGAGDTGTVDVNLTPDSGVALTDFTVAGASFSLSGVTPSNGAYSIPVSFPAGTNVQTITITTSGSTPGDKLFTVSLANASSSSPYMQGTNPNGYNVAISSTASPIVIADTSSGVYSDFAADSSGTYTSEISSVYAQLNGASDNTASTPVVSVEGAGQSNESYLVQTFNDQAFDPTDVLNSNRYTISTIDGVEFEARLTGYQHTGTLNVYISDSNQTIGNVQSNPYPVSTSSLSFDNDRDNSDGSSAGVGGTVNATTPDISGSNVGDLYLLGSINWTADSSNSSTYFTGVETPFNLTNLDPQGAYLLAKEMSNGSAITLVIAPGSNSVAANFDGTSSSSNYAAIEPNLRVDYSTAPIPSWASFTNNTGDNSSADVWITPTHTLAVTTNTSIVSDPGAAEPIIAAWTPSGASTDTVVSVAPSESVGGDYHIGGVDLFDSASLVVDSLGSTRSGTNVNLLVLGTQSATAAPTFSIDSTSTLDLKDNDLAILYGSGTSPLSAVQEDLQTGSNYNASTGVFQWNGTGLISSVAPTTNGATGLGYATEAELSAISENGGGSAVTTFDGQSLGANAVLVKYTLMGDYDLTGTVDGGAYNVVLANYDSTADWSQGNFHYTNGTYSGGVYTPDAAGGQDYNIVLSNYDQSLASYLPGGVGGPAAVKAPPKTVATAVVSTIASTAVVTPTSAVTPSNQKPTTTETTGSSSSTGTKTTTSKSGSKKGSTKTGSTKTGTSTSGKTTTSTVKTTTLSTGSTKTGGKTTTPTTSTTATSTTGKSNKKH